MAYIEHPEVDGGSFSNVALTVGMELGSVSRGGDGNNYVYIQYRIYGYNTSSWSYNSIVFWYNGNSYYAFNSNSGSSHTTKNTHYYGGWETEAINVGANTSATISVGVSQKAWNPSGAAGNVYFTVLDLPVKAGTPVISTPEISNISGSTANASAYVTDAAQGTISDMYIDCATDPNITNIVKTISSTGSPISGTLDGLTHNTEYYVRANAANESARGYSPVVSFITTGTAPVITAAQVTPAREQCEFSNSIGVTYDTNARYGNSTIVYWDSDHPESTSSVTGLVIFGLEPNKSYGYEFQITDNWGRTSNTVTGTFTTTCNAPEIRAILGVPKIGGFQVQIGAVGDTNAPITLYTLFYKKVEASNYTEVQDVNYTINIDNLDYDQDYEFYLAVTNAGGTTVDSTPKYVATKMPLPEVSISSSDITPFSFTINANATPIPAGKTLSYRFSNDGGNTWSTPQSSNSYSWSELTEETIYAVWVEVTTVHTSSYGRDSINIVTTNVTTPADQASVRLKVNGEWIRGKAYVKINNEWVKAKKFYIKSNNEWLLNKNQ